MRYLLYIFLAFQLIGCGTTSSVKFTSDAKSGNTSFLLSDERNDQQKHSRNEEDSSGKNHFFGDDNLNPNGPELLKMTLQKQLSAELSGKSVSLKDFIITVYEPVVSVDQNGFNTAVATVPDGYAVAPLAELVILTIEGMKSEKSVQVQISGDVESSSFSSFISENFKGRVTEANISDTVNKALEDVVSQVRVIVSQNDHPNSSAKQGD